MKSTFLTVLTRFWWFFFALALIFYLLPWVVNPGISLSMGGYDLAEWISLHLPVRPMDSVLLLRLPPALIALMVALVTARPRFSMRWWFGALCVFFIAIALLPPFEFFLDSGLRGDVNYSQQFNLALMTLIAGGIALTGLLERGKGLCLFILSLMVIMTSLTGWGQAWEIMQNLQLPVHPGAGIIGLILLTGGISIGLIQSGFRGLPQIRGNTTPSTAAKGV